MSRRFSVGDEIDKADGGKAQAVQNDPKQHVTILSLLEDLVLEMKRMNKHLESITGEKFLDKELGD
jgi:hypothetical protein